MAPPLESLLPPPLRLLIIHNPVAGQRHRRRLRATLRRIEAGGSAMRVIETKGPGDAERLAREVRAGDCDVLVVAGGDGTINEVVNGLLAAPGPVPPLALIPLGTANVLALEIGLGTRPREVAQTIAEGRRLSIQPGRVNGRHFVMMVGAGFDAEVVAHIDPSFKRRAGRIAYVLQTLIQALRYPFPEFQGDIDGEPFQARWIVVCRGRRYGGPYIAVPDASLSDPHLVVCLLPAGGPLSVIRYGWALLTGRFSRLRDLRLATAEHVRIDGVAGQRLQGDGDLIAGLPAEIGLAARTLDILVPG